MKALSIKQPWAYLVVSGAKPIENRTWRTSWRGPLLIHASKEIDEDGFDAAENLLGAKIARGPLVLGAVIGVVTLVDIVESSGSPWFTGPYGWRLDDARLLAEPVPCSGRLMLWEPPPAVIRAIGLPARQVRAAL
jgi:hypothetical protein